MVEKMSDESASRCMSARRPDAIRQLDECAGIWVSRSVEAIAVTSDQADWLGDQMPQAGRVVKRSLRRRFWVEAALAILGVFLVVVTALWKDWVEIVFRVDPDHHSGALEWVVVLTFVTATIACSALARREWLRSSAVPEAV